MSRITKHESGVGSIFIIVSIIVVLAVAGVIIWQVTKKSPSKTTGSVTNSTTSASSTNPNISSACQKVFNDNKLCAFAEHTNIDTISYIANGSAVEGSNSAKITFTVQHDSKNNIFLTYSDNGQQISVINFNGATYMQDGLNTTWLEYTNSSAAASAGIPNPVGNFELKFDSSTGAGITAIKDGMTTCGKLTCYKYQIKDTSKPTTTQYVWFDNKDYLLREYSFSNSSTGTSANINFVYGSVTIAAPSPVQTVS
jgi:outer membrane lipoprotein-sorting protein